MPASPDLRPIPVDGRALRLEDVVATARREARPMLSAEAGF